MTEKTKEEKTQIIAPLAKWKKYRDVPTAGTMRNICARREDNGAWAFLSLVNGRFYVNLEKFDQWMSEQKGGQR